MLKIKEIEIIKEDLKRFPVAMIILIAITILWPIFVIVRGDFNLIIIAGILMISFSTFVVEVLVEEKEKRLKYYLLSVAVQLLLGGFYLIIVLIIKYKKSEKTLGKYILSVIKILIYFIIAFCIEAFIVMFVTFRWSCWYVTVQE